MESGNGGRWGFDDGGGGAGDSGSGGDIVPTDRSD